jgi:hypothetical protein
MIFKFIDVMSIFNTKYSITTSLPLEMKWGWIDEERLLVLVPLLHFLQTLNLLVVFAYTINTPAGTYNGT